nr:hypothetical protein [Tanacetum cinerariifolium]
MIVDDAAVSLRSLITTPFLLLAALGAVVSVEASAVLSVEAAAVEKKDNAVKRYQALKRKPQTEAQARKNMMIYLKNVAGFKIDYFKGMTYDDIRLIFKKTFNSNLHKTVRLIVPTPPPSSIAQPSSPSQQQQPSQPTTIFMDLLNNLLETCTALTRRVENLKQDKIAQALEITKLKQRVRKLENKKKLRVSGLKRLRKGEIIANIDADEGITLKDVVAVVKEVEVLSVHDDVEELAELQEVIEVVTTAKLMTEVVTAATTTNTAAAPITAAPRIMVEEPEPLKKQAQIEQDEAYARELEAELNKNINWDDVIESPNQKEYDCLSVEYGWIQDGLFKGMSYDDIRPIFEKYFNSNVAFLEKSKEQLEEEESIALKRQRESLKEKTAKKQKLDEEVEELKKHLQIVTNDDDDVYTEATPLALKALVVDYEIYLENNKPFYKIIRADGSH